MRIGVITPEYPPYRGGGIGTATVSFVRNMALAGHAIEVYALLRPDIKGYDTAHDRDVQENDRISVHYLSYDLDAERFSTVSRDILRTFQKEDLSYAKAWILHQKLNKLLTDHPVDVMFSAEYQGLAAYFLLAQKCKPIHARTPLILTLHTSTRELNYANYLSTRNNQQWEHGVVELERFVTENATLLHSPSNYLARFVKEEFHFKRDIHVVPYFPSFAEGVTEVGQSGASSHAKRVLFIGRMERRKGYMEFIQASVRILRDDRSFTFIIAGDDWVDEFSNESFAGQVQKQIPPELLECFDFLGHVPHAALPSVIRAADAVIVPSLFENYPNTCMEAVQLGVPVLIAHSGGMREIVGDDPKTTFNPKSPDEMVNIIKGFFSLSSSERSVVAKEQLAYFTRKHAIADLVAQYEELISKARYNQSRDSTTGPRKGRIGIGVPVYNMGPYLDECIGSILAQKRPADRIVIINDGSTDPATIDKLRQWAVRDGRLEIIDQANVGLCATRNRIIDLFKEEDFIVLLDADDALHPEYLLRTEQYLIYNPDAAACLTWVEKFGEDNDYWTKLPFSFPAALMQNMIISSVALMRRSSLSEDIRFNEKLSPFTAEDWDFWIQFHKKGNSTGVIPEPLFRYRVRKGSKWHSLNYRKHIVIMEHLIETHQDIYSMFMKDVMIALNATIFTLSRRNIWHRIANSLPGWLTVLLRKNAFIKKIGFRLIAR